MRTLARRSVIVAIMVFAALYSSFAGAETPFPGPASPPFDSAKISERATNDIRGMGMSQVKATANRSGALSASVTTTSEAYVPGQNLPAGPVGVYSEPQGNSGPSYGLGATKGHAYGEVNHTVRSIPAGVRTVTSTFTITQSAWQATPSAGGDGWGPLASAVAQVDLVIKYFPASCIGAVPACSKGEFEDRKSLAVANGFTGTFTIDSSPFTAGSPGGYIVVQPGLVAQATSRGRGSSSYARITGTLTSISVT